MGNDVCLLITIHYEAAQRTLKCALKVNRDQLGDDVIDYPMEPENKEKLHALLPLHVRSIGPIIDVSKELFEIHSLV